MVNAGWSKPIDVTRCQDVQPNQAEAKIQIGWSVLPDLGRRLARAYYAVKFNSTPPTAQCAVWAEYSLLGISSRQRKCRNSVPGIKSHPFDPTRRRTNL